MKILCFFGLHQWVCTSSLLAEIDTRQCKCCNKKQYFSGGWLEGKWREY